MAVYKEGGIVYERKGNDIYKNGRKVDPKNYKYIPSAIGGTRDTPVKSTPKTTPVSQYDGVNKSVTQTNTGGNARKVTTSSPATSSSSGGGLTISVGGRQVPITPETVAQKIQEIRNSGADAENTDLALQVLSRQVRQAGIDPTSVRAPGDGTSPMPTTTPKATTPAYSMPEMPTAQITLESINKMIAEILKTQQPYIDARKRQLEQEEARRLQDLTADLERRGLNRMDYALTRSDEIKEQTEQALNDLIATLQTQAYGQAIDFTNLSLNERRLIEDALNNRARLGLEERRVGIDEERLGLDERRVDLDEQRLGLEEKGLQLEERKAEWLKDYQTRLLGLQEEQQKLNRAMSIFSQLGRANKEVADYLGIPENTPTFEVWNALEERRHEAALENARLRAQAAQTHATNINALINLWRATGKAPMGLEEYNIKPGDPYIGTTDEQYQRLIAEEYLAGREAQKRIAEYAKEAGVDLRTAGTIIELTQDNRDLEYARKMVELLKENPDNATLNFPAIERAIEKELNKSASKPFNSMYPLFNQYINNGNKDGLYMPSALDLWR